MLHFYHISISFGRLGGAVGYLKIAFSVLVVPYVTYKVLALCTRLGIGNILAKKGIAMTTSNRGETCTTPNNEIAKCVPARTCTILVDAFKRNKTEVTEFAQQSQCGYDSEPLVCCGTTTSITLLSRAFDTGVLPNRTVCGLDAVDRRIYNGDQTLPKEFPWMAALEYNYTVSRTYAGIKCGGSVINTRYVLTAAHCIETPRLELISVWLGEWIISENPDCEDWGTEHICSDPVKKFNIKKKIPHPYYNATNNENDIGLLRLAKDIIYTDYIIPICLPNPASVKPHILTQVTVAGWGSTEKGRTSDIKLKVKIPLRSNKACIDKLNKLLTANHLCAGGEDGKDSCHGDSGGPLMRFYQDPSSTVAQWYQEGIVSWGVGCGRPDFPAVYTRVSAYVYWIAGIVSEDAELEKILEELFSSRSLERAEKDIRTSTEETTKTVDEFLAEIFTSRSLERTDKYIRTSTEETTKTVETEEKYIWH